MVVTTVNTRIYLNGFFTELVFCQVYKLDNQKKGFLKLVTSCGNVGFITNYSKHV